MTNIFLSLIDLDSTERQLFLDYLCNNKNMECIYYLDAEFGSKLQEFLDLFQGETIKIPSKTELVNIANQVIIYNYLQERNFSDEAYKKASSLFKKRLPALEKIVEKFNSIKNMENLEEENNE